MIVPPFATLVLTKVALAGLWLPVTTLKFVPFNCGAPPVNVTETVPFAQFGFCTSTISGRYCIAIGVPNS